MKKYIIGVAVFVMLFVSFIASNFGYYVIAKANWHRLDSTGMFIREELQTVCVNPIRKSLVIYPAGADLHAWLYHHEMKHLLQIDEYGRLSFLVKYAYYLARYGYEDNPLEIEAQKHGIGMETIEFKYYDGARYRGYNLDEYRQYMIELNLSAAELAN